MIQLQTHLNVADNSGA
ncbi:hypothetical protein Golob_006093 [Gossypium lobatum]|uniref:Uncharacterized protein n=10 Tax=Pentapetalae TaxID=1437201 RepID=A0A7J8MVG3_9ROSI|nr:hypothetical protein [Gossypium lobatum]